MTVNRLQQTRGVSPVLGIVLLVGLVVAMAGVVGAFALGMDTPGDESPVEDAVVPDVDFSYTQNGNAVTVAHDGGDRVEGVSVAGDVVDAPVTWGVVESGDQLTVTVTEREPDVVVRWDGATGIEVLDEWGGA